MLGEIERRQVGVVAEAEVVVGRKRPAVVVEFSAPLSSVQVS